MSEFVKIQLHEETPTVSYINEFEAREFSAFILVVMPDNDPGRFTLDRIQEKLKQANPDKVFIFIDSNSADAIKVIGLAPERKQI